MINYLGLVFGLVTFLTIGVWHPIVVKGEYYFGKKLCMVVFGIVGAVFTVWALLTPDLMLSGCLAVFGFSGFWSVKEAAEQEQRVARGWFPDGEADGKRIRLPGCCGGKKTEDSSLSQ